MIRLSKIAVILLLQLLVFGTVSASAKPAAPSSLGQGLRWRGQTIQIAISASLIKQNPNIKYESDVAGALRRSFETWRRYVDLEFSESSSEKMSISPEGARGDGVSLITIAPTPENVLFFSGGLQESAAATRVFYDKRGFVTEADIALNPFQQFSTDGTVGTFDLESTLTHEIGHLLGLDHSDVLGSTMHEKFGKNGAYGLPGFSARTLSPDDITALQRLYGSKGAAACCQKIEGRLVDADGKPRSWQIWAEDTQSGQVRSIVTSDSDGNFSFTGLSSGSVMLFAQDRAAEVVASGEIGTVTNSATDLTAINKTISTVKSSFELKYLGFNGQLADIALTLNAGKIYTLYLGGKNLKTGEVSVGFTSPYLSVVRNSTQTIDFGSDVSVLSIDVRIDPRTPPGDYTVYVSGAKGVKRYIVGGITVESFQNPWSKFSLTDE